MEFNYACFFYKVAATAKPGCSVKDCSSSKVQKSSVPFRAVAAQGWIPTPSAETAGLDPFYVTMPTQMLTHSTVFQNKQKTQKLSQSLLVLVQNAPCICSMRRLGPEDLFLILGYDPQHPRKTLTLSWCFVHHIHAARVREQGAGCP